jgi:hypothetical protein
VRVHDRSYLALPWNIPVPLKKSTFTPIRRELEPFNVQVDLGQIAPFGVCRTPVAPDALLYADLQDNPDFHFPGRLGSGRSGFYRGRYLKGVGRTPLANNWHHRRDQLHSTGHLTASAAIFEHVVSCFFAAKRRSHLVNECTGLLVAPLSPELRGSRRYTGVHDTMPCDTSLQAITVKSTRFARFSNFAWLLDHLEVFQSSGDLAQLFLLLASYLEPDAETVAREVTPSLIARRLSGAIARGVSNFREYWRMGVYWRNTFNNFAVDGRFHDLDYPMFVGGPYFGVLPMHPMQRPYDLGGRDPTWWPGFNVLAYLANVRSFCRFLLARLRSLLGSELPLSQNERDFVRETIHAFRTELPPHHVLWSARAAARMLARWADEDTCVNRRGHSQLRTLMELACHSVYTGRTLERSLTLPLRELRFGFVHARYNRVLADPHTFAFCELESDALDEARFINDLVARLDKIRDRDRLLAAVEEASAAIAAYCSPGKRMRLPDPSTC